MGGTVTLGELIRREALLGSFLATALAIAALSVPFHAAWLKTAGLIVGAVGALLRVIIAARRFRLERRREISELDRRLHTPIALISEVDPTRIGVDPAVPQQALAGGRLPDYLAREIDARLGEAIAAGLNGQSQWLVVVEGTSKVGKSRTLFEALRRYAEAHNLGLELVAPVDAAALKSLLDPGKATTAPKGKAVLWLDDLESFLNDGVTLNTLREWRADRRDRLIVATYGGKGSDRLDGQGTPGLTTLAGEVLRHAQQIRMSATTDEEIAPLRARFSPADLDAVRRHGLAAYLVAGEALERKLITERHGPADQGCPQGVAVVRTAVDWARCGRTDAITEDLLRRLWETRLPASLTPDDTGFGAGLEWARRPVAGTVALLDRTGGPPNSYRVYDYVTQLVINDPGMGLPADAVWSAAIMTATATEAFGVATAAYASSRLEDAVTALNRARESPINEFAAVALYNLGVTLGQLGRHGEALTTYKQVIDTYRDDPTTAIRETVAKALLNAGGILADQEGRPDQALRIYQQLIDTYSDDPTPSLRERVVKALFNTGATIDAQGAQPDQALRIYQQLIDTYSDDPTPSIRRNVAQALLNTGCILEQEGSHDEALRTFQHFIETYSDDPAPSIRQRVVRTLCNTGLTHWDRGRTDEALRSYQQLIETYGDDPTPSIRESVAQALLNRGVILGQLDRPDEELTTYQQLIETYGDDPTAAIRQRVAQALLNRGVILGQLDRPDEELTTYQQLIETYGDDPTAAIRETVAQALLNSGVILGQGGRCDQALTIYQQLIETYGDDPTPSIRETVANAMFNAGFTLAQGGRCDQALDTYKQLIETYGDDPAPGIRETVAQALLNSGVTLWQLDRPTEASDTFQQLITTYRDDPASALREEVAKALNLLARLKRLLDEGENPGAPD